MKDKIEKLILSRKNRIEKSIEAIVIYLAKITILTTMAAILKGEFWHVVGVYTIVFLLNIFYMGMDKLCEEWNKAKEKDRKENEK